MNCDDLAFLEDLPFNSLPMLVYKKERDAWIRKDGKTTDAIIFSYGPYNQGMKRTGVFKINFRSIIMIDQSRKKSSSHN
jgi:hypothetical protein